MSTSKNRKKLRLAAFGAVVGAALSVPEIAGAEDKTPSNEVSGKVGQSDSGAKTAAPEKGSVKTKTDGEGVAAGPGAPAAPLVKKSYYVPTRGYRLEPQPDIPPYVRNLARPTRNSKASTG